MIALGSGTRPGPVPVALDGLVCASTRSRGNLQSAPGTGFRLMGGTLIRHATGSCAVTAVSLGVHGAATGCCLMPSARFPLVVTAGVMSAAWRTVNLASVAPSTDKSLGTAARTQKHPEGVFINTNRRTCPPSTIAANYTTFYRPHLGRDWQRLGVVSIASGHHRISGRHTDPVKAGQRPQHGQHRPRSRNQQRGMLGRPKNSRSGDARRLDARSRRHRHGNYALALKGNQGTLHDDVRHFLDDPQSGTTTAAPVVDGDHGRIETRTATVSTDIGWLQEHHKWPGLAAVGKVVRVRETTDKTTTETAYYLLSTALSAERLNQVVRAHWGVENQLHWRLDVVMNEDHDRTRLDNAPHNLAVLRHMALNVMQKDITKGSLRTKLMRAGWDDHYLAPHASPHWQVEGTA